MIEELEQLAYEAGQAVMPLYEAGEYAISAKADKSPLTQADLLADSIITQGLRRFSSLPIISEESREPLEVPPGEVSSFWLIDPIDGTKEFIKRRPTFTINIALIENGVPVLGVVYAPALDHLYSGSPDGGLRRNRQSFRPSSWPEKRTMVASLSHPDERLMAWKEEQKIEELIQIGSSIKFCLVASGQAHCYPRFHSLSGWDTAAGHAVALAGGCRILAAQDGADLRYDYRKRWVPAFYVLAPGFQLIGP